MISAFVRTEQKILFGKYRNVQLHYLCRVLHRVINNIHFVLCWDQMWDLSTALELANKSDSK